MRVVFLGHSAGRTGAPMLLLELQRWLAQAGGTEIRTLLKSEGALLEEYAKLGPVGITPGGTRTASTPRRARRWLNRIAGRDLWAAREARRQFQELRAWRPDMIYANTVSTWNEIEWLAPLGVPVLWHVHELSFLIRHSVGAERLKRLTPSIGRFVAASQAVGRALTQEFSVPENQVTVLHEFIRPPQWTEDQIQERRRDLRASMGLPDHAFLVGGCGTTDWRKGVDLFTVIAQRFREMSSQTAAAFLWVGSGDARTDAQHRFTAARAGLSDYCRFIGETNQPMDYLAAIDVFAMVSREDPFPLVMLEAGGLGVPTVCWADSGGAPEYVEADAGIIVPYLSVDRFANALQELRRDETRRRSMGARASAKVRERYTLERQAPRLRAEMDRLCTAQHGSPAALTP
ncbi:MAG: glycosyltransferase family 4 protein [Verrucomicrobiales bacterium]|nr:glycosyltransferase family 4 protein [Verrucomicrobiales bacterium]